MAYKKNYKTKTHEEKQDEIKAALQEVENGVANIFQKEGFEENFKAYLDTMSKFHNYSTNNQILLRMQKPDITHVASFNKWKNEFNRTVKKGEKALKILAPCPYTKTVRDEDGNPVLDEDGNEKKVGYTSFKLASVFDISQTEGEPIKNLEFLNELEGEDIRAIVLTQAITNVTDCNVRHEAMGQAKGYFKEVENGKNEIVVKDGLSQLQEAKTMVHEYVHSEVHKTGGELENQGRPEQEITAEASAYAIAKHFGLDTSEYSFTYVWSWSEWPTADLKTVLNDIQKVVSRLIDTIEPEFDRLMAIELDRDEVALAVGDTCLHIEKTNDGFAYTICDTIDKSIEIGVMEDAKNVFEVAQQIIDTCELKGNMCSIDIDNAKEVIGEVENEHKSPSKSHRNLRIDER